MPEKKAQTTFDEKLVEDLAFEESCDALEAYRTALAAARKQILEEPMERFRAREEELAAIHQIVVHQARVDDRLSKWTVEHEAGTRVRSGSWRVEIKEYTTMEKVENGVGKKASKPKRVD